MLQLQSLRRRVSLSVIGFSCALSPILAQDDAERLFEERIRPLLLDRCVSCHGESDAMGDLRVDSRPELLDGGVSGPALVPGDPEASLLIRAVRHEIEGLEMPMDEPALGKQHIRDLESWIRQGAPWPGGAASVPKGAITEEHRAFWSFRPIVAPIVPQPRDAVDCRTDIDRFLRAEQERQDLPPVADADPAVLVRRLHLDLTGLPPSPETVAAFVADPDDDAWSDLVETLLASPQYGERQARYWLDVARFGEDDFRGLADDDSGREVYSDAWVYRDWVVGAFNDDLPFERFVMAQLAGDLLDEDRDRALPGLGFLGAGIWFYDNAEPAQARANERHDRVDTTTRAFLGLTVGCARCHDHKTDPVTMRDYYALAGVFANTDYHDYVLGKPASVEAEKNRRRDLKRLREDRRRFLGREAEQLSAMLTYRAVDYQMAAWQVTGDPALPIDEVVSEAEVDLETLQRWIDFLDDPPEHYPNLKSWQEMIARGGTEAEARRLAERFQRDLLEVLDDQGKLEKKNEYLIAHGTPPPDERKSVSLPNDFESFFDLHQVELESLPLERYNLWADVYRFDLSSKPGDWKPALLDFWGWSLRRRMSPEARAHVAELESRIESLKKTKPDVRVVMGVKDREAESIADLPLHRRGDPDQLGPPIPRRFLEVLCDDEPAPFTAGSGRMELARAIATHPLAARVMVNRIWASHFGTGLVATPSNFGLGGSPPSHPELLEYLAHRFVASGGSIKSLHREILLSSAYRLSAHAPAEHLERDPENRLLARWRARRLEAEAIRDAMLSVGGNLDSKIGGSSLPLDDDENRRRTLYGFVSRFRLDDFRRIFDHPDPNLPAEKRLTTISPQQSLFLLNSSFVRECARALERRVSKAEPETATAARLVSAEPEEPRHLTEAERLERGYRLLFGRSPSKAERDRDLAFVIEGACDAVDPADAWVSLWRALMSSNEFLYLR